MKKILFLFLFIAFEQYSFSQTNTYLFQEDFSSITSGDNTTSTGSGSVWNGNSNFPTASVVKAFQAGGAVKLGTSSAAGSLTTKVLDLGANSGSFKVRFKVKGWTSVEGNIKVTPSGLTPQTVSYTASQASAFDEKILTFTGGTSNSTILIETTAKRAYLDDIEVYYETANNAPSLNYTSTPVNFGNQNINTVSVAQSYTVNYANLDGSDLVLNSTAPFKIASTTNGTYSTSLTLTGLTGNGSFDVFTKFEPVTAGVFSQTISHNGGGLSSSSTVDVSGTGIDPNATSFAFENCTPNGSTSLADGFQQFSITGAQTWACTSFGRNPNDPTLSQGNAIQMSGYAGGNVVNEDWLISRAFNLSGTNYPILSFWSRSAFAGDKLQLKVSTNYSGTGNPNTATWTNLDGKFPDLASDIWTKSDNINLSAYKTNSVYVAFVYTSTNSSASRWTLDDFTLTNSTTPPDAETSVSTSNINFGYLASGNSMEKSFTLTSSNLTGDLNLTASGDFQISKTSGNGFSNSLTYTNVSVNNTTQTVFVKFNPNQINQTFSGEIVIASPNTANKSLYIQGNSYNTSYSLDVCNWNIEWFGSTTSGQGPSNVTQQATNVRTLINAIGADIYGLAEVVDTTLFRTQVLPAGYNVIFSDFAAYADDKSASGYNASQKTAFMYKTDIIKPINVYGVLRDTYYPSNLTNTTNGSPFKNWSSGRFPFLMEADVVMNGVTERVYFIEIHAKANTGTTADQIDAYNRRKQGADQLKTWIETNLPGKQVILIGDYNDVLNPDKTIAPSGAGPGTSYSAFTTSSNFNPISLSLSLAGKKSTAGYPTVIDNVIISTSLNDNYITGSVDVLDDLTTTITNYSSTTTDHYPILSRFHFDPTTLPIILSSFKAVANGNKNELTWITSSEINSNYFIIEKATDKNSFEEIGQIKGNKNSNINLTYKFTDLYPTTGNNYYRLKQVDLNGNYTYSNTELVKSFNGTRKELLVYPNPFDNKVFINYFSEKENLNLSLFTTNGELIFSSTGNINSVTQNLNQFIPEIGIGYYFLRIKDGNIVHQNKILKK